jgi:hypothetical protein
LNFRPKWTPFSVGIGTPNEEFATFFDATLNLCQISSKLDQAITSYSGTIKQTFIIYQNQMQTVELKS